MTMQHTHRLVLYTIKQFEHSGVVGCFSDVLSRLTVSLWLSFYLTRVYDQPGIQIIILLMIQLIIHVDPSLAVMCVHRFCSSAHVDLAI